MKNEQELLEALKNLEIAVDSNVCQITISNNCPAGWGVVIIAAGVRYFYVDQSSSIDGPRPVLLSAGQTATFMSQNKCVQSFTAALTARIPGEGDKNFTSSDSAPQNQCLLHTTVALGPKSTISVDEFNAASRSLMIELLVSH